MSSRPINVTEPFLPPLEEYVEYLKGIWERNYLTNQGPLVRELERKLQDYHKLTIPVHCVANGALGLQIAIKALGVKGEVITTPFSYVATAACPLWEGCTVKFADIEPDYLTIDPKAVEAAISPRTEAILATHVFGNPCDVEALEIIARKHKLALIYDAAHAFGVTYKGRSILEWGDVSMVSMHATKLFHTVEGGFVVARDREISRKMEWMRRFGHNGPGEFYGIAINAKMTEFHAAMGLSLFPHIEDIIAGRETAIKYYKCALEAIEGVKFAFKQRNNTVWNFSYMPILFNSESALEVVVNSLNTANIHPRRYFNPSLDSVKCLPATQEGKCSISDFVSARVLCLPLSARISLEAQETVMRLISDGLVGNVNRPWRISNK